MNLFEKSRKLEIFIIVAIIGVFGATYALTQKPSGQPSQNNVKQEQSGEVVQMVPASTIKYSGQEGRTALDLLKESHRVDTKSTSFGEMVIGIDGTAVDESKQYWAFYLNGSLSQVGAGTYVTKSGDQIEWKIESF